MELTLEQPPRRTVEEFLEALADLPAQGMTSVRVVQMAGDPDCDIRRLAEVVSGDAVLAAQVLRLANSARFGLSRLVSDVRFAVTMVGFSTLRSLAAVNAVRTAGSLPPQFGTESMRLAVAASLLAERVGVPTDLAFISGMLSELGAAVLHSVDPVGRPALLAQSSDSGESLVVAERLRYGLDHAGAGALVLEHWDFPETLVTAVAGSHQPTEDALTQLVQGARAISIRLPGAPVHDLVDRTDEPLRVLGIDAADSDAVVAGVAQRLGDLATAEA